MKLKSIISADDGEGVSASFKMWSISSVGIRGEGKFMFSAFKSDFFREGALFLETVVSCFIFCVQVGCRGGS